MGRRVLAALLVAFGLALLAGCGSQSRPDEGARSVVAQADDQLQFGGDVMSYAEWYRLSYAELKAGLESGALDANLVVMRRNLDENKGAYNIFMPAAGFALDKGEEYARLLFEHGANPDVVMKTEWDKEIKEVESAFELPSIPFMHLLASEGYVDMMKILVEHGADIDIVDDTYQMTPFLFAGFSFKWGASDDEYKKTLRFLADNGADVNAVDNNGENILGYLAQHCRHELLRYAVKDLGVDINHKSNDDISALGVAAMLAPGSVSVLLDLGAEVDASALRLAVIWGTVPLKLFKDMMAEYDGDVEWSVDMLSDVEWAAGNSLVYVAHVRARGNVVNYNAVKSDIDKKKNKCDPLLKPLDYEEWKAGGQEIVEYLEANYFDSERRHHV